MSGVKRRAAMTRATALVYCAGPYCETMRKTSTVNTRCRRLKGYLARQDGHGEVEDWERGAVEALALEEPCCLRVAVQT